jgi:hypothetical protein
VGTEETTMWRWLRANEIDLDTAPTLAIHPAGWGRTRPTA